MASDGRRRQGHEPLTQWLLKAPQLLSHLTRSSLVRAPQAPSLGTWCQDCCLILSSSTPRHGRTLSITELLDGEGQVTSTCLGTLLPCDLGNWTNKSGMISGSSISGCSPSTACEMMANTLHLRDGFLLVLRQSYSHGLLAPEKECVGFSRNAQSCSNAHDSDWTSPSGLPSHQSVNLHDDTSLLVTKKARQGTTVSGLLFL